MKPIYTEDQAKSINERMDNIKVISVNRKKEIKSRLDDLSFYDEMDRINLMFNVLEC